MKICDHVTEKCFEPSGNWKNPCPHAIAHEPTVDCIGAQCQRFATEDEDMRMQGKVFIQHVEI